MSDAPEEDEDVFCGVWLSKGSIIHITRDGDQYLIDHRGVKQKQKVLVSEFPKFFQHIGQHVDGAIEWSNGSKWTKTSDRIDQAQEGGCTDGGTGPQTADLPESPLREMLCRIITTGAVRFVKTSWLKETMEAGRIVARRQDLPEDAFCTVDEVIAALKDPDFNSRFVTLSYGWLSRTHPDPKGVHLRAFHKGPYLALVKFVFWDFPSLHQVPRTATEEDLFRLALNSMFCLYGTRLTCPYGTSLWNVYRLHTVPADAKNTTPYEARGWTTFESQVCLAGGPSVFNIGCDDKKRPVPMLPDEFDKVIQSKTFTSQKADLPTVMQLYRKVFLEHLCLLDDMVRYEWTDEDVIAFQEVFPHFPRLRTFTIRYHKLSEKGAETMQKMCTERHVKLNLYTGQY